MAARIPRRRIRRVNVGFSITLPHLTFGRKCWLLEKEVSCTKRSVDVLWRILWLREALEPFLGVVEAREAFLTSRLVGGS